jgi:fatty acid desaturase
VLDQALQPPSLAWATASLLWALYMPWSLYRSHRRIQDNLEEHGDIDRFANRFVFVVFALLVGTQIANLVLWQQFAPLLAALCFNLAGAAMQFARLIRSAFRE